MKQYSLFTSLRYYWFALVATMLISFATCEVAHAQGMGNTGTVTYDYEYVEKCVDSAGVKVGFFEIYVNRPGVTPTQTLITRLRANGTVMTTIPAGTVSLGPCPVTQNIAVSIDTTTSFEVSNWCEFGSPPTPFYKIVQRTYNSKTGTVYSTTITNILASNGTVFTPAAPTPGPCYSNTIQSQQLNSTTTGLITGTAGLGLGSWEICNVGNAAGVVTISGGAVILYPGECRSCASWSNEFRKRMVFCQDVSWDATGTEFHIVYQQH